MQALLPLNRFSIWSVYVRGTFRRKCAGELLLGELFIPNINQKNAREGGAKTTSRKIQFLSGATYHL